MGTYVYAHKVLKKNLKVTLLPSGEEVEVGMLYYFTKPYWDAWDVALEYTQHPLNELGIKKKLPTWPDAFTQKLTRAYMLSLGKLFKNAKPTKYIVYDEKYTEENPRGLYKIKGEPQCFYYDSEDNMEFVGFLVPNAAGGLSVVPGKICGGCGFMYCEDHLQKVDDKYFCSKCLDKARPLSTLNT